MDWNEIEIVSEELSTGLIAVRDLLEDNFNGGAIVTRFRVIAPRVIPWSSVDKDPSRFLRGFFSHPVVVGQMPELGETNELIDQFRSLSASCTFGKILELVLLGGFGSFEGSSEAAFELVTEFMREAIGLRFRESYVWFNDCKWTSSWFLGFFFDFSYVWADPEDGTITVLLASYSD